MRKLFLLAAMLFLCGESAFSQTTVVTGTVKDLNGVAYAGATIKAQLVLAGAAVNGQPTVQVTGVQACRSSGFGSSPCQVPFQGTTGPFPLDSTGSFSQALQDNALVTPASTQWLFSVTSNGTPPPLGTGPQSCTASITITGASQSVSASFSACPALSASGVGGGGSGSGAGPVVQSGLLAEYRIKPGETPGAIIDYSGNGNNATGTDGVAPTINAVTGGLVMVGTGAVKLPAAVNGFQTVQAFVQFSGINGVNPDSAIITGNGANFISFMTVGVAGTGTNIPRWESYCSGVGPSLLPNGLFNGPGGVLTLTLPAGGDREWINTTEITSPASSQNICLNKQTSGVLQLGGTSAAAPIALATYYSGTIYYVVFYNRVLTQAEINQNVAVMTAAMQQRGVLAANQGPPAWGSLTNLIVGDGDSLLAGLNGNWLPNMVLNGAQYAIFNNAISSAQVAQTISLLGISAQPLYPSPLGTTSVVGNAAYVFWEGTNDCAASTPGATTAARIDQIVRARVPGGFTPFVMTMLSRTGQDACKNTLNTNIRQFTATAGNPAVIVDVAENATVGADGASAVAANFPDGIHPANFLNINVLQHLTQRAINAYYGNQNFSTGNTYTATATAAAAITAASESTNTMTFTVANAFAPGQCAIVTGVTPAGYNSVNSGSGCWYVLTASGTQFTAFNGTTGLGVGTVFGTASVPQELDADVYATLGGAAAGPIHTLQTCVGRIGPIFRQLTNTNASPWVITPLLAAETINGAATFTTPVVVAATKFPILRLDSILTSASAAGCTWRATIQ